MNIKKVFSLLFFTSGIAYLSYALLTAFSLMDLMLTLLLTGNGIVLWISSLRSKREELDMQVVSFSPAESDEGAKL